MRPFRFRLAISIFSIAAALLLCLTTVALWLDDRAHETQQSQADELAFTLLVELARVHLPIARLQELATAADRLATSSTVSTVLVTDRHNRILVSSDPSLIDTETGSLEGWRVVTVHNQSGPLGLVAMQRMHSAWWTNILPQVLVAGALDLLAAAVLSFLAAHVLTRRLEALLEVTQNVVDSSPGSKKSEDEVSAIGRAIGELKRQVARRTQDLDERDAQIRQIADALPVGMSYVDSKRRLVFVNRTLEGWLGWKRSALLGRALEECLAPVHYQETLKGIDPALRGERIERERPFAIGGQPAIIATINIPDRDAAGRVRGAFSLLRDVTARRAQETESARLLAELAAKNAELERFSYTVSHDLKGPLTTIFGCADLIEQALLDGESSMIPKDLEQIRHTADTMRRMLDELLDLARVGLVANEETRVCLRPLTDDTVRLLAGSIDRHGTKIKVAQSLPAVLGDRQRLQRVLLNLIDNAIKFSANVEHPEVEIGCRVEGEETILFVRDNGRGIPPEQHSRVFDLFRKLDANSEGTGIGLAIVQRIVTLHKGRIWVESAGAGHGTSFCFTLPLADRADDTPAHQ